MMDRRDSEQRDEERNHPRRNPLDMSADGATEDVAAAPPGKISHPGMIHKNSQSSSPDRSVFSSRHRILGSSTDGEDTLPRERSMKRMRSPHSFGSASHMMTGYRALAHHHFRSGDRQPAGSFTKSAGLTGNDSSGHLNFDSSNNSSNTTLLFSGQQQRPQLPSDGTGLVGMPIMGFDHQQAQTFLMMENHRQALLVEQNKQMMLSQLLVGRLPNQIEPGSIASRGLPLVAGLDPPISSTMIGDGGAGLHCGMMPAPFGINSLSVMGGTPNNVLGNIMPVTPQMQHHQPLFDIPQAHRMGFARISHQQLEIAKILQQQQMLHIDSNINWGSPGGIPSRDTNPALFQSDNDAEGRRGFFFTRSLPDEFSISNVGENDMYPTSLASPSVSGQVEMTSFPAINAPVKPQAGGLTHQELYAREKKEQDEGGITNPLLYVPSDNRSLSEYQCLVRKQIEIFVAGLDELGSNAQGRNKPIVAGQLGIRCRHCSSIPSRHRTRGASYYPAQLKGIYQAAQNLATSHLSGRCQLIPDELRQELVSLRDRKSLAGGGKEYWAYSAASLGIIEVEGTLRFKNPKYMSTTEVVQSGEHLLSSRICDPATVEDKTYNK